MKVSKNAIRDYEFYKKFSTICGRSPISLGSTIWDVCYVDSIEWMSPLEMYYRIESGIRHTNECSNVLELVSVVRARASFIWHLKQRSEDVFIFKNEVKSQLEERWAPERAYKNYSWLRDKFTLLNISDGKTPPLL